MARFIFLPPRPLPIQRRHRFAFEPPTQAIALGEPPGPSGSAVWYKFNSIPTQWDPNFRQNSDTVAGLTVTDAGSGVAGTTRATSSYTTGKWQFEVVFGGAAGWTNLGIGICQASHLNTQWLSFDTVSWAYWATGNIYTNSASVDTVSTWAIGDVIGVLIDASAGKLWFTKNGAVIGGSSGGNPATGTGGYSIATGVAWYPGLVFNSAVTDSATANFGATALTYPVSGFTAWDTNVSDSSGNNNFGALAGTTLPTLAAGKFGNALNFSGSVTTTPTCYVAFSNATNLGLPTVTSEFTFACWVKTTSTKDGQPLLSLRGASGIAIITVALGYTGTATAGIGVPGALVRDDAGLGLTSVLAAPATTVNDGTWHHVAFTRNSSQLMTIYVDGVVSGTPVTDTMTTSLTPVTANCAIGGELFQPWYFAGSIDDARIYNRALTSTEIATLLVGAPPVTTWQGTAAPAGTGTLTVNANLLAQTAAALAGASALAVNAQLSMPVSLASFAGASTLTATARQSLPLALPTFSGVGVLAPPNLSPQLVSSASFSGAGLASWPTIDPIDQLLAARSTLTGASGQSSALNILLSTTSTLSGVGTASWPSTDPIDQWMAAYSALAGGGALVGDVTRLVGAGTLWQGTALWAGASALAAQATALLVASSSLAGSAALAAQASVTLAATAALVGAGALSVVAPSLQLASSATLAGASTSASNLLTLRPITATLAGASTQIANTTALLPGAAALAGAATLASSLSQALQARATWAGASGALSSLTQQLFVSTAPFAAAGNLTGDAPVLRAASAAFAGSSALTGAMAQWLTSAAAFGGAGLLTATPSQLQGIAAAASGASTLTSDLFIPGHNTWSVILNVWPAAGTLTAATTARLVAASNLAAASTLAGTLTAQAPISVALAGAGQSAATPASLQLAANASVSGVGGLAANYRQLLAIAGSVLNGLGGLATTTPAQWMLTTSALSGTGALIGDIAKLTGGQQLSIAAAYLGTSALTAQATLTLQGLTAWSGAGALTPPPASVIEPVTLSPAGQGSMAASAALRMSAVFAAAGVGSLLGDVQRFVPGIQQGTAALAAIGSLAAGTSQTMAAMAALSGASTLVAQTTANLGIGNALAGSAALTAQLSARWPIAGLLTGSGQLLGDVQRLVIGFNIAATLGASGNQISALVEQLAVRQTLAATGALTAKSIQTMVMAALATGTGSLVVRLSQFEQVAGTLAAAGYSAAYLAQIQLLSQQILFGTGVLGANLVQTSIRVVSATVIGRPSGSGVGVVGRKPSTTAVTGQDDRAAIVGQGDFVTLH